MLKLAYKRFGFINTQEAWFCGNEHDELNGWLIRLFDSAHIPNNYFIVRSRVKSTLVLQLENNHVKFNRKQRYEIRKVAEHNPIYQMIDFVKLNRKKQKVIRRRYNLFAKLKQIQRFNEHRVASCPQNFRISMCSVAGVKSYNVYMIDGTHVRLFYSWSSNRKNSQFKWSLNRYHLHKDIECLKIRNFTTLDLGGFNNRRMNGIDKFKKAFGGVETFYQKGILVKKC